MADVWCFGPLAGTGEHEWFLTVVEMVLDLTIDSSR